MIVRMLFGLALVLMPLSAPSFADDLTVRLKFWDDGPQDVSFVKFRDELKGIIARKDASALRTRLASDVKLDFGGSRGGAEFDKMWKPHDKNSQVWVALSLVVEQGGNFDSPVRFSAPYAYSAFPSDLDPFDYVVVTAERAVMRDAPKPEARIIRELDRDILSIVKGLKLQHEAGADDWYEVKDAKGRQGFVLACDVRSPVDYRAYFEKRRGRWIITMFLAGD